MGEHNLMQFLGILLHLQLHTATKLTSLVRRCFDMGLCTSMAGPAVRIDFSTFCIWHHLAMFDRFRIPLVSCGSGVSATRSSISLLFRQAQILLGLTEHLPQGVGFAAASSIIFLLIYWAWQGKCTTAQSESQHHNAPHAPPVSACDWQNWPKPINKLVKLTMNCMTTSRFNFREQ